MAKPIRNREIKLSRGKNPMKYPLQLGPIYIGQLVGRDNFNIRQQVSGIIRGIRDARLNLATSHADFVN